MINLVKYAPGAVINLNDNKLTAFAQGVFKSILDYFASDNSLATNSISVTKSKFIHIIFHYLSVLHYSNSFFFNSNLDDFDCGKKVGCGSESWLVGQSDYLPFIKGGVCGDSDATPFSALTNGICLCPSSTSLLPCSCELTTGSVGTVNVTCASKGLGDAATVKLLQSVSPTIPVDTLILSGNKLSKVPSTSSRRAYSVTSRATTKSLLTPFTRLNYVDLSSNVITAINTGDLTLKAAVKFLNLDSNKISSVAAGSLPSKFHLNINSHL